MEIIFNSFKSKYDFDHFVIVAFVYKLMFFICGFDVGFIRFEANNLNICMKIWAVVQCLILCICCLIFIETPHDFTYYRLGYNLVQYFLTVVLLVLIKKGESFFDVFGDLKEIDLKLGKNNYNDEGKLLMVVVFCFISRILLYFCYFFFSTGYVTQPYYISVFYWTKQTCQDLVMFSYAFIFYLVKCRLVYFISILESTHNNFESLQIVYKRLIDVTEKYKRAFDPVFMTTLLFRIPVVMSTIYFTIAGGILGFYKNELATHVSEFLEWVYVSRYLTFLFMPPLCASMLSSCANKISLVLQHKLLDANIDEQTDFEISRFIAYVRARPFQFTVYKMVPLNEQLLGMVLQFCVTYLIVIIQLTV